MFCGLCWLTHVCFVSGLEHTVHMILSRNQASFKTYQVTVLSRTKTRQHRFQTESCFIQFHVLQHCSLGWVKLGFSAGKRNIWLLLWWTTDTCKLWRCPVVFEPSNMLRANAKHANKEKLCVRPFYMKRTKWCVCKTWLLLKDIGRVGLTKYAKSFWLLLFACNTT